MYTLYSCILQCCVEWFPIMLTLAIMRMMRYSFELVKMSNLKA